MSRRQKYYSTKFKQLRALSQQGIFSLHDTTQLKRQGDGKTSRQLLEWRIAVDIGIALFRLAAGWGAEGNAMPE